MSLPANLRVNVGAPFPAQVKASGIVSISKQNGIWTVGSSVLGLSQPASSADPSQIFVPVYNAVTQSWQVTTIAGLQSGGSLITTVTAAQSPYAPKATDFFLLVDTNDGPVEIDLPAAAARNGVALTIKDKSAAATNNITIKPLTGEGIDNYTNASPLVIQNNYDGVKLQPVTGQYVISP